MTQFPTVNKLDYCLHNGQVSNTSTDWLRRNFAFKLQFLSILGKCAFSDLFERVDISKGCKLMIMGRNCFYCYKVTI